MISKNHTVLHKVCIKNNPIRKISKKNHTLLDQFCMNLIPSSRYTRKCSIVKKDPFYVNFWPSLIPPLDIQVASLGVNSQVDSMVLVPLASNLKWCCFVKQVNCGPKDLFLWVWTWVLVGMCRRTDVQTSNSLLLYNMEPASSRR